MAGALERARAQELEAERLRAFREVARRVAHEMRNPLTPIRLAVSQLEHSAGSEHREAVDVLVAESERLEQLAREFTEFGRLPQGPAAPVDLWRASVRAGSDLGATHDVGAGECGPWHSHLNGPLRSSPASVQQHFAQRGGGLQ